MGACLKVTIEKVDKDLWTRSEKDGECFSERGKALDLLQITIEFL